MRAVGIAAAALLLAAPAPAAAQEAPPQPQYVRVENLSAEDLLALAGRLIDVGQYADARLLLAQLEADGAGGVEGQFLAGMIALAEQDHERAEAIFRAILTDDPALVRVRLELARTLFLQGRDEEADYHFRLAIAARPGDAVVATITRFREVIRARRAWRFNLNLGLAPDSNINSATSKEQIEILGLPFELDADARARSGVGRIAGADFSVRLARNSALPVYLGGFGRITDYDRSAFDDAYVGGEAGPEFRLAGGGRLRASVTGLHRWYGHRPLVSSLGAGVHYDRIIDGRLSLDAGMGIRRNDYARRSDADAWDVDANLAINRALGPASVGSAFISLSRSMARDPGYSAWQGRLGLGYARELGWGLRPNLTVELGGQVNDADLAVFGRVRRDWHLQASAGIYKRDWNIAGFSPSLRITWQRNFSTIALYDQSRRRLEVGLAKAF